MTKTERHIEKANKQTEIDRQIDKIRQIETVTEK